MFLFQIRVWNTGNTKTEIICLNDNPNVKISLNINKRLILFQDLEILEMIQRSEVILTMEENKMLL